MTNTEILQITKILSDILGILITLNLGVLAAIITIVEKVLKLEQVLRSKYNKVLFVFSILFLIFSLFACIISLLNIPTNTIKILEGKTDLFVEPSLYRFSIISFFIGVFLFAILVCIVFFTPTTLEQNLPRRSKKSFSTKKKIIHREEKR